MSKPLPCVFCGIRPRVHPDDWTKEGDAWARVQCATPNCLDPRVTLTDDLFYDTDADALPEGMPDGGGELSAWLKERAVADWNGYMERAKR